jgi:hypothetical protein
MWQRRSYDDFSSRLLLHNNRNFITSGNDLDLALVDAYETPSLRSGIGTVGYEKPLILR